MQNEILKYLEALSPSRADDYQTWLEVGMILHSAGVSCDEWDKWSQRSTKYHSNECEKKWRTFGNGTGTVGIGTLAKMAIDDGYTFTKDYTIYDFNSIVPSFKTIEYNSELIKYLQCVFKPDDYINFVVDSYEKDGKYFPASKGTVEKVENLISSLKKLKDIDFSIGGYNTDAGAWIRFNPVNPDSHGSKNEDIVDYRHCLIESDTLSKSEQLRIIKQFNIPCSAIVDSGGKSIHAIVKVDAGNNFELYKKRVQFIHKFLEEHGFAVDKACKNASRLSRMPNVQRGASWQKLLNTNIGTKSYEDWEQSLSIYDFDLEELHYLDLLNTPDEDKSDNLLGDRFLTREGSWLIIAESGVGKSVLAMQMALNFALGRDLWGLKPIKPLKIALIQAENNKLDLVEPLKSITNYLDLTNNDKCLLNKNFKIFPNSTEYGYKFAKLLERISKEFTPDIIIVDPLLSYIGGDISKQEICSIFLRNTIHPILKKYQTGLIFMHHTTKPKSEDTFKNSSYAGAGSSELTNYVRGISTIFKNKDDERVFNFAFHKRGKRFSEESIAPTIYLKQGEKGQICWIKTDEPIKVNDSKKRRESIYDNIGLENIEPLDRGDIDDVIFDLLQSNGIDVSDKKKALQKFWNNNKNRRDGGWITFNKINLKWSGKYYVKDI